MSAEDPQGRHYVAAGYPQPEPTAGCPPVSSSRDGWLRGAATVGHLAIKEGNDHTRAVGY